MKKQFSSSLYIPSVKVSPGVFPASNHSEKPKKIEFARNSIKRIVHHTNNNNSNSNFPTTDNKLSITTQITVKPIYLNKNPNNDQNLIIDKKRYTEKSSNSNCIHKQQQQTPSINVSLKQHSDVSSFLKFLVNFF
jgi:hypothetical protein